MRAVALLAAARFLVRLVPLHVWRGTVGVVRAGDGSGSGERSVGPAASGMSLPSDDARRTARTLARSVERACRWLPGTSRCLPKAVTLQWLMRWHRIPATTVIAFKIADRSGADAYHAWVELEGEMLIGQCDRNVYQPIMALVYTSPGSW